MDKNKICFIRAQAKNDYYVDGIKSCGYRVEKPYRGSGILLRCMRELHFRTRLPFRSIWFNSRIKAIEADYFIISEMLITKEFLEWMIEIQPFSKIILRYENRVNATNCMDGLNGKVIMFSYDPDDCAKYQMKQLRSHYLDCYRAPQCNAKKYDITFVGSDKGRAEKLFALRNEFSALRLSMYLRIVADRSFQRFNKPYYQKGLEYKEYLKIVGESRSILSLVPEGQRGFTLREYEVVFNGVKGITNNKAVINFPLYDKTRYFILGVDKLEDLRSFLDVPFKPISENELEPYYFYKMVEDMVSKA